MSRVRVILDCEWDDLQHALATVIAAKPSFDRVPSRPGWGWHFGSQGRSYFVRQTKAGFSATAMKKNGVQIDTIVAQPNTYRVEE